MVKLVYKIGIGATLLCLIVFFVGLFLTLQNGAFFSGSYWGMGNTICFYSFLMFLLIGSVTLIAKIIVSQQE